MSTLKLSAVSAIWLTILSTAVDAHINSVVVHRGNATATADFELRFVPVAVDDDAATNATFTVVDGRRDSNGGDVDKLNDGQLPKAADQPAENFFFAAGTEGGRLLIDLGRPIAIDQVNSYSWHPGVRGPQVYRLYAASELPDDASLAADQPIEAGQVGWRLLSNVDTRPSAADENQGGQYCVSIFDSEGPLGVYRYLLLDVERTTGDGPFGNTFYSEIDVIEGVAMAAAETAERPDEFTITTDDRSYRYSIDTTETPDLREWAHDELVPVINQWYPRIAGMLPSDDFDAPQSFRITFSPTMRGVAATGGTQVRCAAEWFRDNLEGEAKGAIVHELVHVVQQYGRGRRDNPRSTRPPGWLVEGVADYIRWFLYEPESRGAEITERNFARARYDGSYRVTANFLNWVIAQYDPDIVSKLNAAMREGRYHEDLWSEYTDRTLVVLGDEWKTSIRRQLATAGQAEDSSGEGDGAAESLPSETDGAASP